MAVLLLWSFAVSAHADKAAGFAVHFNPRNVFQNPRVAHAEKAFRFPALATDRPLARQTFAVVSPVIFHIIAVRALVQVVLLQNLAFAAKYKSFVFFAKMQRDQKPAFIFQILDVRRYFLFRKIAAFALFLYFNALYCKNNAEKYRIIIIYQPK